MLLRGNSRVVAKAAADVCSFRRDVLCFPPSLEQYPRICSLFSLTLLSQRAGRCPSTHYIPSLCGGVVARVLSLSTQLAGPMALQFFRGEPTSASYLCS